MKGIHRLNESYILRLQELHQHFHQYIPRHDYLPEKMNAIMDDCLRLWALSDSQLRSPFDSFYAHPHSWRCCSLKPTMISAIASALSKMILEPVSFIHIPGQPTDIGNDGSPFVMLTASTHYYSTCQTQSQYFNSLRNATEVEKLHPVVNPSELVHWTIRFVRWARALPVWVPKTYTKLQRAT
jgi:hypothetical protein